LASCRENSQTCPSQRAIPVLAIGRRVQKEIHLVGSSMKTQWLKALLELGIPAGWTTTFPPRRPSGSP
jgi:hypothetical protein